ncbi:hypothetical protein CONPUDRAFT_159189 [Coniophora puteana RWD-64-598 SS2]|uniref:Uncharacterized protein n=1 Tax=Coniophora puteana (strain RWD-64-598) TaxID=741705 RepID=A0A5M3MA88_CONPW|nr:uncharacterized protein CONPUDRAFT_159189 [Coniophora puteana RWD-64-598 SS2]EIW75754.1 hypothetical protein CONPUDRAFT_159189 [Coniophora puteana RWD-64-598 SS2]
MTGSIRQRADSTITQAEFNGGAVSNEKGPALLEIDPPPHEYGISLTVTTPGIPPGPRLHFTGPSGGRVLPTFRGTGRYGTNL